MNTPIHIPPTSYKLNLSSSWLRFERSRFTVGNCPEPSVSSWYYGGHKDCFSNLATAWYLATVQYKSSHNHSNWIEKLWFCHNKAEKIPVYICSRRVLLLTDLVLNSPSLEPSRGIQISAQKVLSID